MNLMNISDQDIAVHSHFHLYSHLCFRLHHQLHSHIDHVESDFDFDTVITTDTERKSNENNLGDKFEDNFDLNDRNRFRDYDHLEKEINDNTFEIEEDDANLWCLFLDWHLTNDVSLSY